MNNYKIRKIIAGYQVDPQYKDLKLIAIPEKKLKERCLVKHKDETMVIDAYPDPLTTRSFKDKFDRNKMYTLFYFEWKPVKQFKLF